MCDEHAIEDEPSGFVMNARPKDQTARQAADDYLAGYAGRTVEPSNYTMRAALNIACKIEAKQRERAERAERLIADLRGGLARPERRDGLPVITRAVHEVQAERELHDAVTPEDDPIAARFVVGETRYTARTTQGDWIDVTRDEWKRLADELAANR